MINCDGGFIDTTEYWNDDDVVSFQELEIPEAEKDSDDDECGRVRGTTTWRNAEEKLKEAEASVITVYVGRERSQKLNVIKILEVRLNGARKMSDVLIVGKGAAWIKKKCCVRMHQIRSGRNEHKVTVRTTV